MMIEEKTRQRSLRLSTLIGTLAAVMLLIGTSGTAQALSGTWEVFLENCASCFGATYKLEVTEGTTSGGFTNYDVTYTIDTTNYTGGGGLDAGSYKITPENTINMAMWDGGPLATFSDPLAIGSQSANGCNGGSGGGFVCTESSNTSGVPTGGTYVFNHDLKVVEGTTLLDHSEWSFKALYVESDGKVAAQTSASVPIPSTLLLLGGGVAGLIASRWKQGHGTNAS